MSASAARRSTIFPFPSSPHWVPITTVAGTPSSSELQQRRRHDVRMCPQRGEHWIRDRIVDVEEGDRHASDRLATELEARDVDVVLAQERPDPTDDAGNVLIVQHEDVP